MDGLDLEKFFLWVFVVTIFFKGLIYKFRARKKTWIPACPLDKQFSHFACPGLLLHCFSGSFNHVQNGPVELRSCQTKFIREHYENKNILVIFAGRALKLEKGFFKFQSMSIVAIHCYRWQGGESISKIIIVLNNKISSCWVNTASRWGVKQPETSFGSIFLLFSHESRRGHVLSSLGKFLAPSS